MSAIALVRVKRGSTWMRVAPFALASIGQRNATGWHSAMLEPITITQSESAMARGYIVAAPRPSRVPNPGTLERCQILAWFSMATMPRPRISFWWTWFHSLSSVAPPSEKIAGVMFTSLLLGSRSMNVSSRVFFTSSATRARARSRSHTSQSVAPGARCNTLTGRFGFTCSWKVAAPLGHSVPSLCGLRGSPSMFTMRPSMVCTRVAQPTEQYGQTLGVVWASLIRSSCARTSVGARLAPGQPPEGRAAGNAPRYLREVAPRDVHGDSGCGNRRAGEAGLPARHLYGADVEVRYEARCRAPLGRRRRRRRRAPRRGRGNAALRSGARGRSARRDVTDRGDEGVDRPGDGHGRTRAPAPARGASIPGGARARGRPGRLAERLAGRADHPRRAAARRLRDGDDG